MIDPELKQIETCPLLGPTIAKLEPATSNTGQAVEGPESSTSYCDPPPETLQAALSFLLSTEGRLF